MKASELIAELAELIKEHGDCIVDVPDYRAKRIKEFAEVLEVVAYADDDTEADCNEAISFTIWY